MWSLANPENKAHFTGEKAVKFFNRTSLPEMTLGEIWSIADQDNKGWLDRHAFNVALKLIHHALEGKQPSVTLLSQDIVVPSQFCSHPTSSPPTATSHPPSNSGAFSSGTSPFFSGNPFSIPHQPTAIATFLEQQHSAKLAGQRLFQDAFQAQLKIQAEIQKEYLGQYLKQQQEQTIPANTAASSLASHASQPNAFDGYDPSKLNSTSEIMNALIKTLQEQGQKQSQFLKPSLPTATQASVQHPAFGTYGHQQNPFSSMAGFESNAPPLTPSFSGSGFQSFASSLDNTDAKTGFNTSTTETQNTAASPFGYNTAPFGLDRPTPSSESTGYYNPPPTSNQHQWFQPQQPSTYEEYVRGVPKQQEPQLSGMGVPLTPVMRCISTPLQPQAPSPSVSSAASYNPPLPPRAPQEQISANANNQPQPPRAPQYREPIAQAPDRRYRAPQYFGP
ncbi:hypothetical protein BG011_007734 [Mortierella polycephala]|uniref:EH domain-containing protein n=1 Tax=Mortierella polycephala TaxID=41804 RepID=A0A9P6PRP3_9FUNG|nr:hypothetical protein BG011_007734 [Mortierella polycephala]